MSEDPLPPLILCMENASGDDVALRIEPDDDFQSFLVKAKSLLGFEVDVNSITRNQPVLLNDNIYQFLMNAEQHNPQNETSDLNLEILEDNASSDFVYILDDGTQINASQIHFDNEDPLIDLTVENLPFVKYRDDGCTEFGTEYSTAETVNFNITGSPKKPKNPSPGRGFASTLPFKVLSNRAKNFESQINKYLERTPKISPPVDTGSKSPEIVVEKENVPVAQENEPVTEESDISFTREQVLNMFKDSPVAANFSETNNNFNEKRRHVRKTDPTKSVPKKAENSQTKPYIDVLDMAPGNRAGGKNCFICDKNVQKSRDKLYIFDKEDQKLHRSSNQLKQSTQLKILCEKCLDANFKPGTLKSPDTCLDNDEYLVIRNNQQYIFKRTTETSVTENFVNDAKAIIDKVETELLKEGSQEKDVEFVKIEISSDGQVINKSIDNKDNVVIIKEELDEASSDVQLIDQQPIDENGIDNIEEADDEVKEFLGKCQDIDIVDMKCRFCQQEFPDLDQIIDHASVHKHQVDEGELYPCPLCDYGYIHYNWLKGHIKAAHDKSLKTQEVDTAVETKENETNDGVGKQSTRSSPIATRTRSSINKKKDDTKDKIELLYVDGLKKEVDECKEEKSNEVTSEKPSVTIKQEPIDNSDEEAIWIVKAGEEDSDVNEDQLKEILTRVKAQEKCQPTVFCSIKDTHQCRTCKQLFISEETLKVHRCMKTRGRKRKSDKKDCLYLPTQDDTKKIRKRRIKEHSSDPQIVTCHNCNESFTSKVRLKFHMQFHERTTLLTTDRHYQCSECGEKCTFNTETELFDHVHFQHPKQKRWQCPVKDCGKTFYLRATLTKHSRSHTDTRRYVCPACGKRFLDKQTLDEHGVTHLQIKPYQCHICLKQLTRRSRLRMHLRAHEEELAPALVYVCHVCGRAFKDHIEAEEHGLSSKACLESFVTELKEEQDDRPRMVLSPTSGLLKDMEPSEEKVEAAFRKATIKKLFEPLDQNKAKCMLEQVYDIARTLVRVVEIEKAFRCEFCEDVFYLEDSLNNHRVIHKGVKNPFTCHICRVTFATYSRCTTHKTTHGFYKRSLADVKKQADTVNNDKRDVPSAIGILGYGGFPVVKHFLCEDCGRSYLHWTYLQVHRRMKHPDQNLVYRCAQCHLTFPNSWSVSYHKKKVHNAGAADGGGSKKTHDYWIPCRDCEEVLPNKNALYKHRSKEHSDMSLCGGKGNEVARYGCTVCRKTFPARGQLASHARTHATRRPYCCYVCGHTFRTVAMRNEHLGLHTGERPFGCEVCGATFRRFSALRNHRMVHNSYQCPHCHLQYVTQSEMSAHLEEKHNQIKVLEIPGVNPSPEIVMEYLKRNNISPENIVNISKISFFKGMKRVVPKSDSELKSLMEQNPQDCTQWRQQVLAAIAPHRLPGAELSNGSEASLPFPRPSVMQHRPNILQRPSDIVQPSTSYPITLNITGEEVPDVNVQLMMPEGVLVNGMQMVQMQENKDILDEARLEHEAA